MKGHQPRPAEAGDKKDKKWAWRARINFVSLLQQLSCSGAEAAFLISLLGKSL
jgi:hypothetical protein